VHRVSVQPAIALLIAAGLGLADRLGLLLA